MRLSGSVRAKDIPEENCTLTRRPILPDPKLFGFNAGSLFQLPGASQIPTPISAKNARDATHSIRLIRYLISTSKLR